MPRAAREGAGRSSSYAAACAAIERIGSRAGMSAARVSAGHRRASPGSRRRAILRSLEEDLDRAGVPCDAPTVVAAANTAALLSVLVACAALGASLAFLDRTAQLTALTLAVASPLCCHKWVVDRKSVV